MQRTHRFRAYEKWISHINIEDEYDNQLLQNIITTSSINITAEHVAQLYFKNMENIALFCGNKNTLNNGVTET